MPVNRIIATEEILWPNFSKSNHHDHDPVVYKVDNAIHWISLHSVVNAVFIRWIVTYEAGCFNVG